MVQPPWKTVWGPLKKKKKRQKLNIELLCDQAITLLHIYPNKTIIKKDTCTPVFIAALFTKAKP